MYDKVHNKKKKKSNFNYSKHIRIGMQNAQLLLIIEDKAASVILEVFTSLVYCHNYVLFLGLSHRCTNLFFLT